MSTCNATVTEAEIDPRPATTDDRERKIVMIVESTDCKDASVSFAIDAIFHDEVQDKKRVQRVDGAINLVVKGKVKHTVTLYPDNNESVDSFKGVELSCTCHDV